MRYVSTRGAFAQAPQPFCAILLEGLAPDGGLAVPQEYPRFTAAELEVLRPLGYRDLAFAVLSRFIDDIPAPDLQAIIDAAGKGTVAATKALAGADAMFAAWWSFKEKLLTRADLQVGTQLYREQFKRFCTKGTGQNRDRRWRALGRDLLRQWDAVFLFLDVEGVEPTNNAAEQGLRSGVIWRRTTQGTRTAAGSTFVQRIMTAHANCKRQSRSVLRFLADTLLAHRGGLMPPSLMPPGR